MRRPIASIALLLSSMGLGILILCAFLGLYPFGTLLITTLGVGTVTGILMGVVSR